MTKLVFSLSGEGRGHATRVRTIVESLRQKHEVLVLAPGDAFDFLSPLYRGTDVRVERLPGLRFHYKPDGALSFGATLAGTFRYVRGFPGLLAAVRALLARERPTLAITDFEPSLPRAARSLGIPFVSFTHQHFLLTYNLSSLPPLLRFHARYMSLIVRAYYSGQQHTIVSSFYFPPLSRSARNVTQVGVMLRPEIRDASPSDAGHLVAYLRRFASNNVLEALKQIDRPVRVYGLGHRAGDRNLCFKAVNDAEFIDDLVSCTALIATAGNQLLGEALYLGKPCFVMPERHNHEQFINAHFLAQSGAGTWMPMEKASGAELREFLANSQAYAATIDRRRLDGLPTALRVLETHIKAPPHRAPDQVRSLATEPST